MQMYYCFSDLINTWNKQTGPALIFEDDCRSISYAELAEKIGETAAKVRTSGIGSELIVTDHLPDTLIRIFACVLAGCDVVLIDESTPDEALFSLAGLVAADSIYASDPELLDDLSQVCANSRQAGNIQACNLPEELKSIGSTGKAAEISGVDDCPKNEGRLIFFTSGTTGSSRAVVLTSRSLLASAYSGQCMLPCGQGDIILSIIPFSHVFGFVCTMLWGLAYGASIALGRGTRYLFSDCGFFRPTILPVVPSLVRMLMSRKALPDSLRIVLVGAAPLGRDTVTALQATGTEVYLGYGLTETSSGLAITQDREDPFALYPCPGADIRIEPDGEISVATPCMMEGYLDFTSKCDRIEPGIDSGRTGASALGHPIIPVTGGRFYTGDLGAFDANGTLRLTGRKKDMLVLPDGMKIFCPEYEGRLSELLGTQDLSVILKNDRPVLVIGEKEDIMPDAAEKLIEQFNEAKARGLQICDILYYGRQLPRTATGKIKRWEVEKNV